MCNDLVVVNQGNTPTFKNVNGESIIDITLATPGISRFVRNWRVITEEESLSLHRYIRFDIQIDTQMKDNVVAKINGWRTTINGLQKIIFVRRTD